MLRRSAKRKLAVGASATRCDAASTALANLRFGLLWFSDHLPNCSLHGEPGKSMHANKEASQKLTLISAVQRPHPPKKQPGPLNTKSHGNLIPDLKRKLSIGSSSNTNSNGNSIQASKQRKKERKQASN